jgi:RNA-directed DNA polymerase
MACRSLRPLPCSTRISMRLESISLTRDMIVVRYADDQIVGFEHEHEAKAFLHDLHERLRAFELALHPDKTRLIRFGRDAAKQREARGEGKPETFDFLGFTHFCTRSRKRG